MVFMRARIPRQPKNCCSVNCEIFPNCRIKDSFNWQMLPTLCEHFRCGGGIQLIGARLKRISRHENLSASFPHKRTNIGELPLMNVKSEEKDGFVDPWGRLYSGYNGNITYTGQRLPGKIFVESTDINTSQILRAVRQKLKLKPYPPKFEKQ